MPNQPSTFESPQTIAVTDVSNGVPCKDRLAKVNNVELATNWELQQPTLLWRHPVGLGWSSFAVVGNAAVSLEQREENECVVCYEVRTGVEIWCHGERTRFTHEYGGCSLG